MLVLIAACSSNPMDAGRHGGGLIGDEAVAGELLLEDEWVGHGGGGGEPDVEADPVECGEVPEVGRIGEASSGDRLPSTAEVSFCVGADGLVTGWSTFLWWSPGGRSVVCHQGRQVVSSRPFEPVPDGYSLALEIELDEVVELDGDCSDIDMGDELRTEIWAFEIPSRVLVHDPTYGWVPPFDYYDGATLSFEELGGDWSVRISDLPRSSFVLP